MGLSALRGPGVRRLIVIAPALLLLGACAAGSAASHHAAGQGALYQFILGFWHGVIAPVTLIVEIVNKLAPKALPWRFHLYETQAAGVAYDIGFYLGLVGGPFVGWSRRPGRR
jgi:hypothetical protein